MKKHIKTVEIKGFYALSLCLFLAFLTPCSESRAEAKTIAVSDYHLKLLIQEISPETEVIFPFKTSGDPHHYEPPLNAIKSFLNAKYKILNRTDDGWRKGLEKKLKDQKGARKQSLVLNPLAPYEKKSIKQFSSHALAHFWLNPIVGCHYYEIIKNYLTEREFKVSALSKCPYEVSENFQNTMRNFPWHQVILTHDASIGLFSELAKEKIFVLKNSDHAGQIGLIQLKQLYQLSAEDQKKPLLWLVESQLDLPTRVESRIRKFDHVIKIDTVGKDLKASGQIIQDIQKQVLKLQQGLADAKN